MSKRWLPCAILVKVIPIDFPVKNIFFLRKKMFFLSCSNNAIVTSQNDVINKNCLHVK